MTYDLRKLFGDQFDGLPEADWFVYSVWIDKGRLQRYIRFRWTHGRREDHRLSPSEKAPAQTMKVKIDLDLYRLPLPAYMALSDADVNLFMLALDEFGGGFITVCTRLLDENLKSASVEFTKKDKVAMLGGMISPRFTYRFDVTRA